MGGQQSARVNVDDETWVAFRVLAVRQGRSIADYLGELVKVELVEHDDRRGPTSRPPMIESTDVDGLRDTADEERPTARSSRTDRVRLADVELLTALPAAEPFDREV